MWYWYTYGEDNSHCGSCSDWDGQKWCGLLTQLTPAEMQEKAAELTRLDRKLDHEKLLMRADQDNGFYFSGNGTRYGPDCPDNCEEEIDIGRWTEKDLLAEGDVEELVREREAAEAKRRQEERKKQEKLQRQRELRQLQELSKKHGKTLA